MEITPLQVQNFPRLFATAKRLIAAIHHLAEARGAFWLQRRKAGKEASGKEKKAAVAKKAKR